MAYLNGIDISNWQKGINLTAVPADFVICKATEGTTYVSPDCDRQYQQAKKAGKLLGVYHFATGGSSGVAEADWFLKNIEGYVGEAILVLDWEANAINKGVAYAKAFLDRVYQRTKVRPLIYMSNSVIHQFDWSPVVAGNYGLWNAGYYAGYQTMGYNPNAPIYGSLGEFGSCAMYQYTSSGRLSGYSGNLDLNVFYGDKNAWKAYAKGSGTGVVSGGTSSGSSSGSSSGGSQAMRNAQVHINNFTGAGIPVDGLNGPKTRKGIVKSLQVACNMDYGSGLSVDGIVGSKTNAARGQHYVAKGETQYLVTFVEIGLTALGYYTGAVESPGIFGSGLYSAVVKYQKAKGLTVDGIAGRKTMNKILTDLGCI